MGFMTCIDHGTGRKGVGRSRLRGISVNRRAKKCKLPDACGRKNTDAPSSTRDAMGEIRMKNLSSSIALVAVAALALSAANSQAQQKRVSPHETISTVVDGNRVTLVYGRPYSKDPKTSEVRKIWGGLVPAGKAWRLGADEATLLITQQDLVFGETAVPAGAYTLYMLPDESGEAKLIVSKQIGQWGSQYDGKQDFASIPLKKEPLEKTADQFTASLEKNPTGGGMVRFSWENTQFSVPFTVKK